MIPATSQVPDTDTLAGLLLTLTALSGEFPSAQVSRLPGTEHYQKKVVKALKRDKLVRTFYHDGLRGLRLTAAAKKLLLTSWPDRFQDCLTGNSETNVLKSEITRRLRLHRMAEVLMTMYNAGVISFPWQKPAVFQPEPDLTEPYISQPVYYSSREMKEIGPESAKIRGSRATGILLTDGGIFVVYNTADTQMKWEYKAETRLKALLQVEICQRRLPEQFVATPQNCIVFGTGMRQMEVLMGAGGETTPNYFVMNGSFQHVHYLTNDHHGEVVLQHLFNLERKVVLDEILSENLSASRPGWPIENDGIDEAGAPVLFGYTCDMPRIQRYDTALELHGKNGTLICFDFQEESLRRFCGPRVTLQSIDFEAYERSVLHIP